MSRLLRAGLAGVSVGAALAFGCSHLPPPMVGDPGPSLNDSQAEAEYRTVVGHFSTQRQIFIGFDTILFGGVTYESLAFREARVRRRDAFQLQTQEQLTLDLQTERSADAQFYDFMFGAYVQNPRFDDFDLPNSIWRVALVTPSGEVAPVSVKRLGKADINTRAYFPYMGDFWTVYRVRFPKAVAERALVQPGTATFTFLVASTLGKAEFVLPLQ